MPAPRASNRAPIHLDPHMAGQGGSVAPFCVMDEGEGPGFGAMIGLVAVVVATVILVFFGIGYALGRLFL